MNEKPKWKPIKSNVMCQCFAYEGKPHRLGAPKCDPRAWVSDARYDPEFRGVCQDCALNDEHEQPESCAWIRGQESFKAANYHCEILRLANGGTIPKKWYPRRVDDAGLEYYGDENEWYQDIRDFIENEFYGGEFIRPANTEPEEGLAFTCVTDEYDCVLGSTCAREKECAKLNDKENKYIFKCNKDADDIPFD